MQKLCTLSLPADFPPIGPGKQPRMARAPVRSATARMPVMSMGPTLETRPSRVDAKAMHFAPADRSALRTAQPGQGSTDA
jgi:hypothetical protein